MGTLDYRALAVLDAVVTHGSFDKAALALGITQSAVSQRIKALEDAAGRLLIVRGQPSVPTGLGQRLAVHHRNVKLMEAALDIDLGNDVSMPDIAVAVDPDSLATWFPQSLAPLLSPPRCQLDVRLAAPDLALQLVREGAVFACISAAESQLDSSTGTSARPLGKMRYVCVATPVFAGHWFGDGFTSAAVRLAPAIVSEQNVLARHLAEQLDFQEAFPHHTLPVSNALYDCIADGLAYGMLPWIQVAEQLERGRLVDLTPGRAVDIGLTWHAWNIDTPFTRSLTEQVLATARRYLLQG